MAQVVNYYKAEMAYTDYAFQKAEGTSGKIQLSYGDEVRFPPDYGERVTNSRWPIIFPHNGYWVNYWTVGERTPVYKTVTDVCTQPDELALDTTANTLAIIGGAGGDLNTLQGFGVSWRERDIASEAWGEWSAETATAGRTVSVSVTPGKVRQYRVRTQGSAGEAYYSAWVICTTLLNGNTANEPTVLLPVSGAVTVSRTPVVVVSLGADSEGDRMDLQRSIDGGEWFRAATAAGTGETVYDQLQDLTEGSHTIRYKVVDINAGESAETAVTIVVQHGSWTREIASGDIISNAEISHVADINEMLYAANVQRMYYGLPEIVLPGTVGMFADWDRQMKALLNAAKDCQVSAGQLPPVPRAMDGWPNAALLNQVREAILSV